MTLFITGTHTGIGKTVVTGLIARELHRLDESVITQKWIQTGCSDFADDLLTHADIIGQPLEDTQPFHSAMNPYCFSLPASPHLAAETDSIVINPDKLTTATQALQRHFKHVLIEGAGGIMVPITRDLTLLDLVGQMKLPTVVVVQNELGCINHALLTISALAEHHVPLLGIIMNTPDSDTDPAILSDNPRAIETLSGVPILAEIPFLKDPKTTEVDFSKLLSKLV